eukprot:scaffold25431_cov137-Amphora_coffeaeformis.AAC.2
MSGCVNKHHVPHDTVPKKEGEEDYLTKNGGGGGGLDTTPIWEENNEKIHRSIGANPQFINSNYTNEEAAVQSIVAKYTRNHNRQKTKTTLLLCIFVRN